MHSILKVIVGRILKAGGDPTINQSQFSKGSSLGRGSQNAVHASLSEHSRIAGVELKESQACS